MSDQGKAVFLSYASQDSEAARRIAQALRDVGIEVWFDQSELRGGEAWDQKIRKQIKECALFVPLISESTQARLEGYFRREWKQAVDRTHDMAEEKAFLLPVLIDETTESVASVPEKFREVQWLRAIDERGQTVLAERVRVLLAGTGGALPKKESELHVRAREYAQRQRTGLLAIVYIDAAGVRHRDVADELIGGFAPAEVFGAEGNAVCGAFTDSSAAVRFALMAYARLRRLAKETGAPMDARIAVHADEVPQTENAWAGRRIAEPGEIVDRAARVAALGHAGQVLLTRRAFDDARQALKGQDLGGLPSLSWVSHGQYTLGGGDEPVEVCEVAEVLAGPLAPPPGTKGSRRVAVTEHEPVLGWRPALGQLVPDTLWVLETKLGEGGFGEVWLGRHQTMKERRVFKFCFQADRARSLKRELTLFRVLKERVGDHPNIVRLLDVHFNEAPIYVEMDYVDGLSLKPWCEQHGGIDQVPLTDRLEVVAQIADALQAAHDAGVIHRDVKPGNILVSQPATPGAHPRAKLSDFGIGQVVSEEVLQGVTKAGFTQSVLAESSSYSGTQLYMAPELFAGEHASPHSDLYSLGVVLFQLLVGDLRRPVATDWAKQVADPLIRHDLEHCFAWKKEERFVGAGQLARNLRAWPARCEALARQQAEQAVREKAAYRNGMVRAAAVAIAVVAGVAGLAILAAMQARKARAARQVAESRELAARRTAYASDMSLVQRSLQERNLGRAIWVLDRNRPMRDEIDLRHWEWRYFWERCRSEALFSLGQHSNSVTGLTLVNKGEWLAVADKDGVVRLWEVATRREVAKLQEDGICRCMATSTDGRLLAVGGDDANGRGVVRVWEIPSKRLLSELPHERNVRAVAFSKDANQLVTYESARGIWVWDLASKKSVLITGSPARGGIQHEGAVLFSPDDRALVLGGRGGNIRVFDRVGTKQIGAIKAHSDTITALAISPDGTTIASAAAYSETGIKLWEVKTGKELGCLTGHSSWVTSLCFSQDGKTLVSASGDQTIRFWDCAIGREIAAYQGSVAEIWALSFSPDYRTLYSGGKDGSVLVWNAQPAPKRAALETFKSQHRISFLAFSPDGQALAVLGADGSVVLRQAATVREIETLAALGSRNSALAYSQSGRLLAAGNNLGGVKVWDLAKGALVASFSTNDTTAVITLAKFISGDRILVTVDSKRVRLWDVVDWRESASWPLTDYAWGVAVSPDEQRMAFAHEKRVATVYDLATGREQIVLRGHKDRVSGVAFTPDGNFLLAGSEDATARLWNLTTEQAEQIPRVHKAVHSAAISADGRRLMTGSGGREAIKLWDISTLRETATLEGQGSLFGGIQSSPDGNLIVGVNYDGLAHVWRAPSWAEIAAAEKAQSSAAGQNAR